MPELFDKIKKQVDSPAQSYDAQFEENPVDLFTRLSESAMQIGGSQLPGFEKSEYESYLGETFSPMTDIDERRAQSQGGWRLLGNAIGQGLTEATLGAVEGVGYVLDFEEIFNADKQAQEGFDNWFSEGIRQAKEYVQDEVFPVYQTRQAQHGSLWERLGDPSFRAAQGRTIGTTLSLLIPSFGVAGAASRLATAAKLGQTTSQIAGGMAAAAFSRKAESAMESQQLFEQEYQRHLNDGLDDAKAKELAGKAAATVFNANAAMLPMDMVQYSLALKSFSGIKNGLAAFKATRGGKIAEGLGQIGSEALEEAYQFTAQEEAVKAIDEGITPFGLGFGERLSNYIKDPEFQTSAFLGGAMGGLFHAFGPVGRKIAQVTDAYTARKLSAANTDNVDAFIKMDNKAKGRLLTKALVADRLPIVRQELEDLKEHYVAGEKYSEEEASEHIDRINQMQSDIDYISEADESLKRIDEKYATNPNLRKEYTLLKWEDRLTTNRINELESQENKLLEDFVDVRDNAVYTHRTREALKKEISNIEKNDQLDGDVKEVILGQYNKQLKDLDEQYNSLLEEAKEEDPNFKVTEYTSPNIEKLVDIRSEIVNSRAHRQGTLRPRMAQIERMSKTKAAEEEKNINDEIRERVKEAAKPEIVQNIDTAQSLQELKDLKEQAAKSDAEEIVNDAIKTRASREPVNYTEGKPKPSEIYRESIASFEQDRTDLVNRLRKELKDIPAIVDNDIERLRLANSLEEVDSLIDFIYNTADQNDLYKGFKNVIDDFYAEKYKLSTRKPKDAGQEVVEYGEDDISKDDQEVVLTDYIPNRGVFDATLNQMEMYKVTKDGNDYFKVKYDSSGNPVPNKSPIVKRRLNWKILNHHTNLLEDSEVEYEVDLAEDYAPGKKGVTWENFQIQAVTYRFNKTGNVIGVLPDMKSVKKEHPDRAKLEDLRKKIYDQVTKSNKNSGFFKTGIKTTVERKHAGRIWRVPYSESVSPDAITKANNIPLVYGVAVKAAGQIEFPNLPKKYQAALSSQFLDKAQPGAVYQFVPATNGEYIPLRLFTRKVNEFTTKDGKNPIKRSVYNKVLKIFEPKTNIGEITRDIKSEVYIDVSTPKDGKITLKTSTESVVLSVEGLKAKDPATLEAFNRFLDDRVVQIDSRKINNNNYNLEVAKYLKINVNPKEYMHSTRFTLSTNYTEAKTEITESKQPAEAPIQPRKGELTDAKDQIDESKKTTTPRDIDTTEGEDLLGFGATETVEYSESGIKLEDLVNDIEFSEVFTNEDVNEGKKIVEYCKGKKFGR